jgi:predicted ATP-grasp superfamily ATP-dependent carboligase
MRALIVEHGWSRAVLAASRGLAREGWTVGVGSPTEEGLARRSRSVARWHWVPPPQHGLDAFVDAINEAIATGGYQLVFAGEDTELFALSLRRDDINAQLPHAAHSSVVRALDKLEVLNAAQRAGFATPRSVLATADSIAAWQGPAIVKARAHPSFNGRGPTRRAETVLALSAAEVEHAVAEIKSLGVDPFLQEVIGGRLTAYVAVVDGAGRVVAEVQQRADLTWPPYAGTSVRARTTPIDPDIARAAAALFADLGWFGLAELQFQAGNGQPQLIDFNGRFYGSMGLAIAAGVNVPAIWAALATDRSVRTPTARIGVRYHWLEADLRRALRQRRRGVVGDVLSCLSYAPRAVHSIWTAGDAGPALARSRLLLARSARKLLRAHLVSRRRT